MAANEIHEDDIGVVFQVTIEDDGTAVDVSGATTQQILFGKPDGTKLTKTSGFTNSGSDGKVQYASVADDLTPAGQWYIQVRVVLASGSDLHSDIAKFIVHPNL